MLKQGQCVLPKTLSVTFVNNVNTVIIKSDWLRVVSVGNKICLRRYGCSVDKDAPSELIFYLTLLHSRLV